MKLSDSTHNQIRVAATMMKNRAGDEVIKQKLHQVLLCVEIDISTYYMDNGKINLVNTLIDRGEL